MSASTGSTKSTETRRGLGGMLRRIVRSNDELESEDLRRQSEEAGAALCGSCNDRQKVRLRGTVSSVTINPQDDSRRLEVDFRDGTGQVTLVWMGRRSIPGIQAGTTMLVEGRLSRHGHQAVIYNPRYELLNVPGI